MMTAGNKQHGRVVKAQKIILADLLGEHDLSTDQLIDLAIMIGTDFHPGIRGIGPKTGIKLIKQFGDIETICAEKDKEVPQRLDEIREIFRNHPSNEVPSQALQMGEIDVAGLKQFLQIDRQFSQRRMDNAMEKLTQAGLIRESGQTSLFSF